jgi:hypothetical protein
MNIIVLIIVLLWGGLMGALIALKWVERELDKDIMESWDAFCKTEHDKLKNPEEDPIQVAYVCDCRACKDCDNPDCHHTFDIRHARNFELVGENCYSECLFEED